MANERKASAPKESLNAPEEKKYRVIHTIVLGKGDARESRSSGFVTAAEVGGEREVEELLRLGAIGDLDAPVRPSEASELRARTILTDIAIRGRVIVVENERYTFAGRTFSGAAELNTIALDDLGNAIVDALTK